MYGPAFPFLGQRFGLGASVVALAASAHFLGASVGPLLAASLLSSRSVMWVSRLSFSLFIAGTLLLAFAPLWSLALAGAALAGLGSGSASTSINATYASFGTRTMNLLNVLFGLGSVLSSVAVATLAPWNAALPFLTCTLLAIGALWIISSRGLPPLAPSANAGVGTSLSVLVLSSLLLGVYVAVEVGFGAWLGQHLSSLDWKNITAIISAYWGGMILSRVLVSLSPKPPSPAALVGGCLLTGTLLTGLLVLLPAGAPFLYPLIGFCLGPVFSTTLVWVSPLLSAQQFSYMMVAGSIGGIVSPSLIGWLVTQQGTTIIPTALLGMGLLACLIAWQLNKMLGSIR